MMTEDQVKLYKKHVEDTMAKHRNNVDPLNKSLLKTFDDMLQAIEFILNYNQREV